MNEEYEFEYEQSPHSPEGEMPVIHTEPAVYPDYPEHSRKKKKKGGFMKVCALVLICSVLSAALGAGGAFLIMNRQGAQEPDPAAVSNALVGQRENTKLNTVPVDTGSLMTAAEVYAANVGSTVGITTSITTNFWGFQTTSAASGSGFIITDDGYILTNYHVVEGANSITVSCYDGTTYDAVLIGYDESNDLAVLKVDAEGLAPVILGDSDNLNVGDSVVAIGNPLGELTFSLTAGLVSAMDREVTLSSSVTMNLLQTDCAINSGNSGGALFNMYGEVIGITNAKYSSSSASEASIDNIGFAIPINSVLDIVQSIMEKGYISKPYIGVSVLDVTAESQMFGVPAGAAIQSVTEGAPAAQAGLQYGDVITQVNGTAISGSSDLVSIVGACAVGDELTLVVYRQGQTLELTLTVGEQVQSALANEEASAQQQYQQYSRTMPGSGFGSFPGSRP